MKSQPRRLQRTIKLEVSILAIDASFDAVSQAAAAYRQRHVYPYLAEQGFNIVRFQGPLARRYYAAPEARRLEVEYVTGAGHGAPNAFLGDYYDPILQVGDYSPAEVRGKIIHLLSCKTARELGRDFIAHGCRAFFGYDEDFILYLEEAELFLACDAEIDYAFAEGLTADEVYKRVRKKFDQHISELRAADRLFTAAALEFDRDHLCAPVLSSLWGDGAARLAHSPPPRRRKKKAAAPRK